MKTFFAFIGAIASVALLVLIMPFISFWIAYFGGWLASLVIGGPLCNALNTLCGTDRFIPEMLPWIAGAFGWIVCDYNLNLIQFIFKGIYCLFKFEIVDLGKHG